MVCADVKTCDNTKLSKISVRSTAKEMPSYNHNDNLITDAKQYLSGSIPLQVSFKLIFHYHSLCVCVCVGVGVCLCVHLIKRWTVRHTVTCPQI